MKNYDELFPVIEAILFMSGDPVSYKDLCDFTDMDKGEVKELIEYMKEVYERDIRGITLITFNENVQLSTKDAYYDKITEFFSLNSKRNLSNAALETISIIAYKQPITKQEIEEIRGVKSDAILKRLLMKELIDISGTLDRPGRPNLYVTTDIFLKKFGISTLDELPEIVDLNSEEEI